ncbi:MAG: 4Fe-4S binding protein [Armatimonadota bacterium]|nr:4Fe-4S binding protein [Armatimonadota bacterium]
MVYVITNACHGLTPGGCRGGCADICPVDGIEKGLSLTGNRLFRQFFIDPDACIECGRCQEVCTTGAIISEEVLSPVLVAAAKANAEFFRTGLRLD